ncbi:TetR/AcrR family transcriptional regulator [Roseibium sp.]|uniref:TetR/AcrR family transcriptional regulator n=1 Tax=Roseibium sp. TaxID=1936156 RepID=UPI003A9837D8
MLDDIATSAADGSASGETKGSKTAKRVRAAALKLFARHGYAAVSMRQIASEVGVQPGALYNHFPTKQHILKDLMLQHMRGLHDAWADWTKQRADTADPLESFVSFHIGYHLQRADEVFVSYMELRNLEPENFREIEATRQSYEAILTEILNTGAAAGRYEVADPRVATRAIIAMLTGIPTWYRQGGSLTRHDIETIYLDMVRKSVAPGPDQTPKGAG